MLKVNIFILWFIFPVNSFRLVRNFGSRISGLLNDRVSLPRTHTMSFDSRSLIASLVSTEQTVLFVYQL